MNDNKTLTYLYSKGKNRFVKIVYLFFYGVVLLVISVVNIDGGSYKDFFIAFAITIAVFELIKRAFYYVVLGTVRPDK